MLRVSRFDTNTYLELKDDKGATGQAVAAFFLASLGPAIGYTFLAGPLEIDTIIVSVLTRVIIALIVGLLWSIVTFLVGTKLFRGKTLFWELARPLFFSYTPFTLFVLLAIPVHIFVQDTDLLAAAIYVTVAFWGIIGGVAALKNAMGFGYDRSMLTYILGWLALIALYGFL